MPDFRIADPLDFAEREFVCDSSGRKDPPWKTTFWIACLGALLGVAGWLMTDRHLTAVQKNKPGQL
jgi:hypothetical protein